MDFFLWTCGFVWFLIKGAFWFALSLVVLLFGIGIAVSVFAFILGLLDG